MSDLTSVSHNERPLRVRSLRQSPFPALYFSTVTAPLSGAGASPPPLAGGQLSPGPLVARNTVLNVFGQLVPIAVGLVAIPIITRALGDARFGLLGLMWAVLGYFSVFDLGLGRATTKFVAERLAQRDDAAARRIATLSVACQTAVGIVGGAILAALVPSLVMSVLKVPDALRGEARAALLWLALSLPLVVLSLSLRGVLEATQRFDLVNLVRIPGSAATFLVPAIAAPLGTGLPGIVVLLLGVRILTCWATAVAIRRALPGFRWELRASWAALRPLLSYGGWVTVSNFVSPLLTYLERFVLGSIAGLAAVAYYTAPYEAVNRLLILPASLSTALFPAVSGAGAGQQAHAQQLLGRSVRYLLLAMAAPVVLVIAFPRELLTVWLGATFAAHGADAVRILAAGILVNGLAHLPYVYLLGQGRPDVPAKFHLLELPLERPVARGRVRRQRGRAGVDAAGHGGRRPPLRSRVAARTRVPPSATRTPRRPRGCGRGRSRCPGHWRRRLARATGGPAHRARGGHRVRVRAVRVVGCA
ncbi:MAG: hypothetical protein DMD49_13515 [Gemmatimonadetes bacterium]|nr:MAG: hypothetical protein DMD49_13515 [Gemmatimonadota bacterium]